MSGGPIVQWKPLGSFSPSEYRAFLEERRLKPVKARKRKRKRKRRARGQLSAALRFQVLERDGFACRYCGRAPADGVQLHVDHVLPVSSGGGDDLGNLLTSCADCNLGKGSRVLQ